MNRPSARLTGTAVMATLEKCPDLRFQQTSPTDSGAGQTRCSLETDWKTPTLSVRFQSRFGDCSSVAGSGVTSCSDSTEGESECRILAVELQYVCLVPVTQTKCRDLPLYRNSPSFRPIKTQETIPTAHVMPSTAGTSPSKRRSTGEPSSLQNAPVSSKAAVPGSPTESAGLARSGEPTAERPSQVLPLDLLQRYGTCGETGLEQSWFPVSDHMRAEDTRKFDIPAIEPTLNQSALLDTLYAEPHRRFQDPDWVPSSKGKELYKVLPESKPAAGASDACEPRNGTWPPGSRPVPLGFQPSNVFSKPMAPPSRGWRQEPCTSHPHPRGCELSAWRQQLDSMRLQVEQMQLQNGAVCHQPSMCAASLLSADPAQWVGVLSASESLLKEKEILIDRQRQHITQLEQKARESELQVHSALSYAAPYGDICMLRVQVSGEMALGLAGSLCRRGARGKSLPGVAAGAVPLAHLSLLWLWTVGALCSIVSRPFDCLFVQIKGRDRHINSLKKKCQKESEQSQERQQRIETLERYLADLPTLEDHQKQSQQLKESEQTSSVLQEAVAALRRELGDVRAACREQEAQLETQNRKELELLSTVHSLQERLKQCVKRSGGGSPVLEVEKQKPENASLQRDCDRLRKIVDKQQKKMEQLSSQVKSLGEQVSQEEGTSQALKEEAVRRESALQQLRAAVKELSVQNQDLIEKNLTLQERLRQVELSQPPRAGTAHLAHELHGELAGCLQDLQSVYSIVTQRAQGKDPNLSLLLGIHSVQLSATEPADSLTPDGLARKLLEVKQLRREVEDLRTAISDRYAQDMGDNCIAQ
nr:centrosomal protein of 85 kDa [Pelodiscus sinensis]|eukprot:XP_025038317.1 centrosomal protein of 85 kDa [Pelodiscus sinensis]